MRLQRQLAGGWFAVFGLLGALPACAQTLKFSGYEWKVKSGEKMGPGPNRWDAANVRVDSKGWLHLKISHKDDVWSCAEVQMTRALGFGTYQFQVIGRLDQFDKNIVLGLFDYPTPDIGGDGTNEIDIEFARWGNAAWPNGNYTVWPAKKGVKEGSSTFEFTLNGDYTTQRFTWKGDSILFQSLHGHRNDNKEEFGRWLFHSTESKDQIPQQPLPVLLNLWLFHGDAPSDGKEVEIVLRSFKFTPAKTR